MRSILGIKISLFFIFFVLISFPYGWAQEASENTETESSEDEGNEHLKLQREIVKKKLLEMDLDPETFKFESSKGGPLLIRSQEYDCRLVPALNRPQGLFTGFFYHGHYDVECREKVSPE